MGEYEHRKGLDLLTEENGRLAAAQAHSRLIREKIAQLRIDRRLTASDVARMIGISRPFYTQLEGGKRRMSMVYFLAICRLDWKGADSSVAEGIWKILELAHQNQPGFATFRELQTKLSRERQRAARKYRFRDTDESYGDYFGPEILPKICAYLQQELPEVANRPFYFLVDDYSIPKITSALQINLNRLLMQRTAGCFFKVSTESPVSFERADIDGKAYVEGREFFLVNLGLVFLKADARQKEAFIADVFERRFQLVPGFPIKRLANLLGSGALPSFNETARQLSSGKSPELWGIEALNHICSGDIFYLITLVDRMVRDSNVSEANKHDTPAISKANQFTAIREEAGNFLNSLRGIPEGEHLVKVVTAFGNVARSYLKYRKSKNESGDPPHQASRIEPYEELQLSQKARRVYRELLRYSLFIEDPRGKSRRGRVVPRLYLRRCLVPHFGLTFSKRDSVELEPAEIEQFLLDPDEFESSQRLRNEYVDEPISEPQESDQTDLFGDSQ